jgi:hypothetical protein
LLTVRPTVQWGLRRLFRLPFAEGEAQVAQDIGRSPTTVQRLLREGLLRRFKGGIAESSFEALLREHPDRIPYGKLPPAKREWLVLNGYPDQALGVKAPSVRGLLE